MKNRRLLMVVGLLMISALAFAGITAAQEGTPEPETTPEAEASTGGAFLGVLVAENERGAGVGELVAGGPADAAGVQVGDVIVTVNGEAVTAQTLRDVIGGLAVGDVVTLDILRGEEEVQVEVTLSARPVDLDVSPRRGMGPGNNFEFRFGDGSVELRLEDGALVVETLAEDNPLYEVGLRQGDRITAVNGQPIGEMGMMPGAGMMHGENVTITVERDGETLDLEILVEAVLPLMLGIMPDMMQGRDGRRGQMPFIVPPMDFDPRGFHFGPMMGDRGRLGLTFVTLDEATAAENQVEATEGALVIQVEEGSAAAEAGLQADDIITAVNGEMVDAERTLADRIHAYEAGDVVTLDVLRGGEMLQIEVTLGQYARQAGLIPAMPGMSFNFSVPQPPAAPNPNDTSL